MFAFQVTKRWEGVPANPAELIVTIVILPSSNIGSVWYASQCNIKIGNAIFNKFLCSNSVINATIARKKALS